MMYVLTAVIVFAFPRSYVEPAQQPGKNALEEYARQCERIASLYVDYDVYAVHDGEERRFLSVVEWRAHRWHYTSMVHWYDNGLYPLDEAGGNDQENNWFLWTPGGSIQCHVCKRQCHTWPLLPAGQRDPGCRFYSGLIGLLPPQLQLDSTEKSSATAFGSSFPTQFIYFPHLMHGQWTVRQADADHEFVKASEPFRATMRLCPDGPRLLERTLSVSGGTAVTIHFGEHRLHEGVWLPHLVSVSQAGVRKRLEMRVKNLSLNDEQYAAKSVTLLLPSGTVINPHPDERGTAYVAGGVDLLEDLVRRSRDARVHWGRGEDKEQSGWSQVMSGRADEWAGRILPLACGLALGPVILWLAHVGAARQSSSR